MANNQRQKKKILDSLSHQSTRNHASQYALIYIALYSLIQNRYKNCFIAKYMWKKICCG